MVPIFLFLLQAYDILEPFLLNQHSFFLVDFITTYRMYIMKNYLNNTGQGTVHDSRSFYFVGFSFEYDICCIFIMLENLSSLGKFKARCQNVQT